MTALPLRVCYFGTYRAEYSRNQIMLEGLRRAGVEVIECHEQLWLGVEDRVQAASGGWLKPAFWGRFIGTYLRLIRRFWGVGKFDVMVCGYPGQIDVYLARLLSGMRHKPLAWDIFMSIYLIALERGLDKRSRFTLAMLRRIEKTACRLPDLLILDTSDYANWFETTHGIPAGRFHLVPTGADDRVFHPIEKPAPQDEYFRVVYYGSFIPNHGVEYIVEAAQLLSQDASIQFELIGDGPDKVKAKTLAAKYSLPNLRFVDWLDKADLVKRAASADILLGAFGTTPQSLMTVQNKIYEGLAMGRPVITGVSPALAAAVSPTQCVYLCERESPQAIADAIRLLKETPSLRKSLSENGFARYQAHFTTEKLGAQFKQYLMQLHVAAK
jgi:glycosyltransferase involved in cell wall biosynthesis